MLQRPDKPIVNADTILNYIPQRPPFVLLSRIYACTEERILTGFDVPDHHFLVQEGCLSESGLIENMAQSSAASAGYHALQRNAAPVPGFIGNIKDLVIDKLPLCGSEIITEVITTNRVLNVTLVKARVFYQDTCIASCELKVFRQQEDA